MVCGPFRAQEKHSCDIWQKASVAELVETPVLDVYLAYLETT